MLASQVLQTAAFLIAVTFVIADTQFQPLPMGRSQFREMEAARVAAPTQVAYKPYPMHINVQGPRQPQIGAYPQPVLHRANSDRSSGLTLNSGIPRNSDGPGASFSQTGNVAGYARNSAQPRYSAGYPQNSGHPSNFPRHLPNFGQPRNYARNPQNFGRQNSAGYPSDSGWIQNPGFGQKFGEYPQNSGYPQNSPLERRTG